jgi:hypothetical protein
MLGISTRNSIRIFPWYSTEVDGRPSRDSSISRQTRELAHVPAKWPPVRRQEHAPLKNPRRRDKGQHELVEEVAQCHDVRVSGHGAADPLDGQACGPSQRWKAASMRPLSTPTFQPVRRHHTLGTLLATMSTVSNGVPGGSNEVFGVWRRDAPDGCPNRHDDGMRN